MNSVGEKVKTHHMSTVFSVNPVIAEAADKGNRQQKRKTSWSIEVNDKRDPAKKGWFAGTDFRQRRLLHLGKSHVQKQSNRKLLQWFYNVY